MDQDSRKGTLNLKGAAAGDKSKRGSIAENQKEQSI
jgi:hypothetical protein